jgi:hypothetical protein
MSYVKSYILSIKSVGNKNQNSYIFGKNILTEKSLILFMFKAAMQHYGFKTNTALNHLLCNFWLLLALSKTGYYSVDTGLLHVVTGTASIGTFRI